MTIGIIVGSPRPNSQSGRVGRFLAAKLHGKGHGHYLLDLKDNPIPLWAGEGYTINDELQALWQPYSERLAACDGFIIITPEWGGMATPHIKNVLMYCSAGELAHKPGLIVSVVASKSGAYPVSELRSFSAKNNQLVYIPDHLIVRWAVNLALEEPGKDMHETEQDTLKRLNYSLDTLIAYTKALKGVRESGVVDVKTYPFGM